MIVQSEKEARLYAFEKEWCGSSHPDVYPVKCNKRTTIKLDITETSFQAILKINLQANINTIPYPSYNAEKSHWNFNGESDIVLRGRGHFFK